MDWTGCEWVESVPERLSGVPVVRHSRVQADAIVQNFDDGSDIDEIAYNFSLPRDVVAKVLAFASRYEAAKAG